MTIYVDGLRDYRAIMGRGFPGLWCHMITDGDLDELHEFAAALGISPRRFQNHPRHPHYDLLPTSRCLAVALGARQISTRQMARILQQKWSFNEKRP
ncbi:MAG: DUF4031 domain-containing protein [Chloroflexi bacterium]|nr:MAG: DUF4031 domain-containing protein [Chloroflexota bacterium]